MTPWSLTFSADGGLLAVSRGAVVRVWETATGREVRRFVSPGGDVTALAFSADARALAAAGDEDVVHLWELATGKERRLPAKGDLPDRLDVSATRLRRPSAGVFLALVFSPDGKTLLGGRGNDDAVYVWDLQGDRPTSKVSGHRDNVRALAVSRDGKTAASASADSTVLIWDLTGLKAAAH